MVLEKWFWKLDFFFWSTTFLQPEKIWIYGIKPPFFLVNHFSRTRFLEPDFSNQISRTTFLEPLFYNFVEKWLQNKWSTSSDSMKLSEKSYFFSKSKNLSEILTLLHVTGEFQREWQSAEHVRASLGRGVNQEMIHILLFYLFLLFFSWWQIYERRFGKTIL